MAITDQVLDEVRKRLKVRGDAFLDSDGERLVAELKQIVQRNRDATKAIEEIEHRRSERIE